MDPIAVEIWSRDYSADPYQFGWSVEFEDGRLSRHGMTLTFTDAMTAVRAVIDNAAGEKT
jgi:hypothetical protein